jgi:two-component system response regulator HydG
LRALQERSVRPVGSDTEVPFDTRIIAATHRDLEAEVAAKRFREDLYYRIHVVQIEVPPLRRRPEDIPALATHFLRRAAKRENRGAVALSPDVARVLLDYDWPGNVRELENCMDRAVALARHDQVSAADLPERIRTFRPLEPLPVIGDAPERILSLEELERRYILHALKLLQGNRVRAAELLGLDRRTLSRRLDKYLREAPSSDTLPADSASATHS